MIKTYKQRRALIIVTEVNSANGKGRKIGFVGEESALKQAN